MVGRIVGEATRRCEERMLGATEDKLKCDVERSCRMQLRALAGPGRHPTAGPEARLRGSTADFYTALFVTGPGFARCRALQATEHWHLFIVFDHYFREARA